MKTVFKLLGYVIGILLMTAGLIAIVMYIMGIGRPDSGVITTMPPVESSTPAPDGNTVLSDTQQNGTSSVTVGTPTPSPSPTPEVTPEPTPVPTPSPEPQPSGTPLGGGKFSSDTGKWIDVDAIWEASAIDVNTVKVTVSVTLRSYALQSVETRNGLDISLGDDATAMDVPAITIEGKQEVATPLGTYDFTVNAPIGQTTTLPLSANWHFGGVYSGTQLDVVTASGDVVIKR